MAMVKKSITVTDQQEQWIQAQMATGQYGSDSELFRELIRERQLREEETSTETIEAIRKALIKAEKSGFSDRSAEEIMATVIKRRKKNGAL